MIRSSVRPRRLRAVVSASPYRPVLAHAVLRRVLPGLTVSSLGDGMAVVAVSWLALRLTSGPGQGLWVAAAAAAYTLPGALGAVALSRFLSRMPGLRLTGLDATLRMLSLGVIAALGMAGSLGVGVYVALLGASSVLHSWGRAGRYSLIAEVLPGRHHVPGNAVLSTLGAVGTVAGPAVAGVLIARSGAVVVFAVVTVTFAVLAASCVLTAARARSDTAPSAPDPADDHAEAARGGVGHPHVRGVLLLSAGFYLLFGSVYVALPVHVATGLHASAGTLAVFYSVFGIGSVVGGVLAGYLRRTSIWPTMIGLVIAFGAAMLPLGLGAPVPLALFGFGIAGLLWPPYATLAVGLLQHSTPAISLTRVLAVNSAIQVTAVPLGTGLGGPLVAAFGAGHTLLISAATITVLGTAAGLCRTVRRARCRPGRCWGTMST